MCECGSKHDTRWFHWTWRHCIFGSKTKKGELPFTHQPCNFNLVLGFSTSEGCVLFPRCWWNQWDSSPIHHRYSNTNSMWVHVIIWSQWCHFYGCHTWQKWHEIPSIHLDGVWWSSQRCPFYVDRYK